MLIAEVCVAQATALSCSIFHTLLVKFRRALKAEISEFFPKIFLRPLEAAPAAALGSASGAPLSQTTSDSKHQGVLDKSAGGTCPSVFSCPATPATHNRRIQLLYAWALIWPARRGCLRQHAKLRG